MSVEACPVPQEALLQRYAGQGANYTDCYTIAVPYVVTFDQFVTAFYTTPLFRAERFVLGLALRKRINDADIAALLAGSTDHFAAWRVEARGADELMLCDLSGHTRSWFLVRPITDGHTRLYFGSAVVAKGTAPLPVVARLSMPLHRLYSRSLLAVATRNLSRS